MEATAARSGARGWRYEGRAMTQSPAWVWSGQIAADIMFAEMKFFWCAANFWQYRWEEEKEAAAGRIADARLLTWLKSNIDVFSNFLTC